MYLFHNDYNEACHSSILERIEKMRTVPMPGYGMDPCCLRAADMIRTLCENENLAVHFLAGGTQSNLTVVSAALRPHQAVLAAESAHVNAHETGAIEATGHKVVTVASTDGKLTADQIEKIACVQCCDENAEHTVQIKLVYISHPTELGTTYRLSELEGISEVCKKYGMYLFVDGARLGYALAAKDNDITLADLARLSDVFYIGGTKCGAMFGEAIVIANPLIAEDFRYLIKQHGGMLAKGWLLGLQFETLFEDGLYFSLADRANQLADQLRQTMEKCKHSLYTEGTTNQVFAILPDRLLDRLSDNFTYMIQEQVDNQHKAVRFCTSWATTQESVDALCAAIEEFSR